MMQVIPAWIVIAVVSRDILIIGGVLISWLVDHPVAMKPLIISKANTTVQIIYAGLVMADLGLPIMLANECVVLGYIVAITTILSALAYLVEWFTHMGEVEAGE